LALTSRNTREVRLEREKLRGPVSAANLIDIEYLAIKLSLQALGLDVVVPLSFGFLIAGLSGAISTHLRLSL